MIRVLISGANGQLGKCFQAFSKNTKELEWHFCDRSTFNVLDPEQMDAFLRNHPVDYLINCAAYTQVDQAEESSEQAHLINVEGAAHLAKVCKEHGVHLVQISTDFVFDGKKTTPYTPLDTPNPISVYGSTKHKAEQLIAAQGGSYSIIRTSWLYSMYGHNFYKTILRLSQDRDHIKVVNDQWGVPVSAEHLAREITQRIIDKSLIQGLFHYAHSGSTTWFGFAKAIVEKAQLPLKVFPISTQEFGAAAARPSYSVLENSPLFKSIGWESALAEVIHS